jgi:hypothetical protein
MKLVRFGPRDAEKPGIVTAAGTIKDVSASASTGHARGRQCPLRLGITAAAWAYRRRRS